jgi:predicted permease
VLRTILRRLLRKAVVERELDDEIQSYLNEAIRDKIAHGMSPEAARRAALIEFGGTEHVKENVRDNRKGAWVESVTQDLQYAFRAYWRTPGFTLIAVLTLAVGIGASAAVFSVVDRMLFRSLPYADEDRLVSFGVLTPLDGNEFMFGGHYLKWRGAQSAFSSMTSYPAAATVSGGADCEVIDQSPQWLTCAAVESNFLTTLGVRPLIGRDFEANEGEKNGPNVAVISHALWRSQFANASDVLGKVISVDGRPTTIIGVLPSDFELPSLHRPDLLTPQAVEDTSILRAYGRLKNGVTIERAEAALQPLFQDVLNSNLFLQNAKPKVQLIRDRQVHDVRLASYVLFAAVLTLLLIACVNLANLLLARAAARQREFAIRAAIGAARRRLIRQALTEAIVLSLVGGVAGCGLASVLLRLFVRIAPDGIPRLAQATIDLRVLLFSAIVSLASGIAVGLAPVLKLPEAELLHGRSVGSSRTRLRHVMIGAQIAMSLMLLSGAGLLLRTLWNFQNVPLGFRSERVITAAVRLGEQRYSQPQQQAAFFDAVESRLAGLSGIGRLAISSSIPLVGPTPALRLDGFKIEGRPQLGASGFAALRRVSPNYFAALGISITRGRSFEDQDRNPSQRVMILSERLARLLFEGDDPIGKRIRFGDDVEGNTVIGIAADVRNNPILTGSNDPEEYLPWKRSADSGGLRANIILHTTMNSAAVSNLIREQIAALDPTVSVDIQTMNVHLNRLTARPRFNAILLGSFAAVGVLLAAIGLYGVVSFLTAQRTQEIGVRMAVGATPAAIMWLVLSQSLRWTVSGAAVGLVGSFFTTRVLRSLLFQVTERDPWTLSLTVATLVFIALIASWIPSWRASRVDPMTALRRD